MIASLVGWALLLGFIWLVLEAGLPAYRTRVRRELAQQEARREKTGL